MGLESLLPILSASVLEEEPRRVVGFLYYVYTLDGSVRLWYADYGGCRLGRLCWELYP